jgi:hypothetical protein
MVRFIPPADGAHLLSMEEAANFTPGCFKMNHDGSGLCVVWEQRIMHTGGRYTYVKWWVPVEPGSYLSPLPQ